MPITKDIVFMIGCPRSGTTLLNHLLRDELGLGYANELQLIPKYYKKIKTYGDLTIEKNLNQLIRDIMEESYFQIFKTAYSKRLGRNVELTYDDIFNNILEPSFAGVIYAVLKTTADQLGTEYVGNKHLSMGLHLDWLYEMFPNARLIHVVRDGRDCALSLRRLWWGQKNVYTSAVLWAKHIKRINHYLPKFESEQFMELRYEDFLSDPVKEMKRLHQFVRNSEPRETQLERYVNINRIIKKGNTYKWKKKMTQKDCAIFQAVAGNELSLYGYEQYPVENNLNFIEKSFYILEDRIIREYNYRFNKN